METSAQQGSSTTRPPSEDTLDSTSPNVPSAAAPSLPITSPNASSIPAYGVGNTRPQATSAFGVDAGRATGMDGTARKGVDGLVQQPDPEHRAFVSLTPAEKSHGVWMSRAPPHGGVTATGGGGGGAVGEDSSPTPLRADNVEAGTRQTGGELAAGEASIEAATAKLSLDDNVGNDDHDVSGAQGVGVHDTGPTSRTSHDEDWQDAALRDEREREPQPKFGLKVLVPGVTAGCLIGKGGRIINQLQTTTGTRVKLSQKNEFFPGTHDRVALVQGEHPAMVADAVAEMLRRLREAGRQHSQASSPIAMGGPYPGHDGYGMGGGGFGAGGLDGPHGRNAQVTIRLLVPLAAGGLIIGRGGETVKAIGAKTGARVILAGKDADVAGVPSERLCSIQGDLEGAIKVVIMIVGKMAEDRGLSKYQSNQTCYQSGTGIGMGLTPGEVDGNGQQQQHLNHNGGLPAIHQQQQQQQQHTPWGRPNRPHSGGDTFGGMVTGGGAGGGVMPQGQEMGTGAGAGQPPRIGFAGGTRGADSGQGPGPRPAARHPMGSENPWGGGVDNENASPTTTGQNQVLGATSAGIASGAGGGANSGGGAIPGGISTGVGVGATRAAGGGGASGVGVGGIGVQQAALASGHVPTMMAGGVVYGYPYAVPAMPQQRAYGEVYAPGNVTAMSAMYPYGTDMSLVPQTTTHQVPVPEMLMDGGEVLAQTQVIVPDHMVGVILGKGGATVIEMQKMSGARIQVSQRGEYVPGTQNRPVTISGTQQAVMKAQVLVNNVCAQAAQYDYRHVQGMPPGPQQPAHQQQQQHPHHQQHLEQHHQHHLQPQQPPFY